MTGGWTWCEQGTITGWRSASRVGDKPAVAFGADRIQAPRPDRRHRSRPRRRPVDRRQRVARHAASRRGGATRRRGAVRPGACGAAGADQVDCAASSPACRARRPSTACTSPSPGRARRPCGRCASGSTARRRTGCCTRRLDIALDGMAVQNMPPQAMSLMPHHLELRPSVAGVSLAGLTTLALEATDQDVDQAQLQADAAALLAHGGVTVGLDTLDTGCRPGRAARAGPCPGDRPGRVSAPRRMSPPPGWTT